MTRRASRCVHPLESAVVALDCQNFEPLPPLCRSLPAVVAAPCAALVPLAARRCRALAAGDAPAPWAIAVTPTLCRALAAAVVHGALAGRRSHARPLPRPATTAPTCRHGRAASPARRRCRASCCTRPPLQRPRSPLQCPLRRVVSPNTHARPRSSAGRVLCLTACAAPAAPTLPCLAYCSAPSPCPATAARGWVAIRPLPPSAITPAALFIVGVASRRSFVVFKVFHI